MFAKYRQTLARVAPEKGLDIDRIITGCAIVFAGADGKLKECDPQSIVAAVMQCSMLGLSPNPAFGECYFVPYGGKVQMQLGYHGWIKMAAKGGTIKGIRAAAVYEGDEFKPLLGSDNRIHHRPGPNFGDPGKVTWAYAIATMASGHETFAVLSRRMIERLRLKNPMQGRGVAGAWATDFDKMAMAKAIKQVLKFIPAEDHWRAASMADESIPSLDQIEAGSLEYSYPTDEIEAVIEASATAPAIEAPAQPVTVAVPHPELTEEQQNEAAFQAQMAKEAAQQGKLFGSK
jgi:recombination protein RecT